MAEQQAAIELLTQQVMELNNRLIAQQLGADEDKARMLQMEQQRFVQEGAMQEMRRQTQEMVGQAMASAKPSLVDTRSGEATCVQEHVQCLARIHLQVPQLVEHDLQRYKRICEVDQ